jgi:polyhydroxybutyrate depolymerase
VWFDSINHAHEAGLADYNASMLIRYVLPLLLMCLTPVATAAPDPYPPLEQRSFEHQGVDREYFVHRPAGASGTLPLVLAIHGYTSTATGFAVFHDLRAHADAHGYVVVFPQSSHFVATDAAQPYRVTSWNMLGTATADPQAGPQCSAPEHQYPCPPECGNCDRCGWASCYDDLGYFEELLDAVAEEFHTDPQRTYALGMSNGGMMALRLGCELPARFAAIAPIAAQMPRGYACTPQQPLPMLHLAGGRDDVVQPGGLPSTDGFVYESVTATTQSWAQAMACSHGPATWANEQSENAGLTCTAWSGCSAPGEAVISCVDPDETHNWPARRPGGAWPTCVTSQQAAAMPEQRLCEARTESGPHRGMDLVWAFFSQHRRP